MHFVLVNPFGLRLPRNGASRLTDFAQHELNSVVRVVKPQFKQIQNMLYKTTNYKQLSN